MSRAALARSVQLTDPGSLQDDYYEFRKYVSQSRMLTYWHQIVEVLNTGATSVLEVGVGSGVVTSVLRHQGLTTETVDLNPRLNPDHVGSVTELSNFIGPASVDLVLCARVLHHVDFSWFEAALLEMSRVTRDYVVLTLPVDELRVYVGLRATSTEGRQVTIRLPRRAKPFLKRMTTGVSSYDHLWKVGSSDRTSLASLERLMSVSFSVERSYSIPTDRSHHLFVLRKR